MKHRTRLILKTVFGVLTLVLVGYIILAVVSTTRLRTVTRALEADGRPMRNTEVIPPYVDDTHNGALLYQSAYLALQAEPFGDHNLLRYLGDTQSELYQGDLSASQWAELQEVMARSDVQHALAQVMQGVQRPACRFDVAYNQGFEALLPHVSLLRRLSSLLALQAEVAWKAGDPDAAWQSVVTGFEFADALRDEPMVISQLVRFAQFGTASKTLRRMAIHSPPSPDQAAMVDRALARFGGIEPMVLAMDGERLLGGEWAFDNLDSDLWKLVRSLHGSNGESTPGYGRRWAVNVLLPVVRPVLVADRAAYNRIMLGFIHMLQEEEHSSRSTSSSTLLDDVPAYCLVTRLIVPALDSVVDKQVVHAAAVRVLRAGLVLSQYRAENGAYPPSLEALGDRIPADVVTDPDTGETLLYESGEAGVRLSHPLIDQFPDTADNAKRRKWLVWTLGS